MPRKKIEMANLAQKPKRVGQQLETNILGSSIYETSTVTGYRQLYSQKSKRVGESTHL